MKTVGIVIPYYQRRTGILRRALVSILAQNMPPDVSLKIVVVNDGSPAPVAPEIDGLEFREPFTLEVVNQANGGCAVARNSGLKALDGSIDFVGFLDSDDYWDPDHIAKALAALGSDFDFYFTDHSRLGKHTSRFANIHFPPSGQPEARLRQVDASLWEIDKTYFFHEFLRVCVVHLSSFVYRRNIYPDALFKDALRAAGEDYLFMLSILTKSRKVCFRTEALTTCADGVNIYVSASDWNDEKLLGRIMGDIIGLYAMRDGLKLSPEDASFIRRKITMCRRRFAFFSVRRLLKFRERWSRELMSVAVIDRGLWLWLLPSALLVTLLYPLRLYSPLTDVRK